MTAQLSPFPKLRFTDDDGAPLVGGKLYTYEAGTTTPLATYTDRTGGTPNANPVILDARGEADVWLASDLYKFVLKDADDGTVWTVDNVSSNYIYADNITWTGTHTFNGDVVFGVSTEISGAITIVDPVTINSTLHVAGNSTLDGTLDADAVESTSVDASTFTVGNAGTIEDDAGTMLVNGAGAVRVDVDTAAFSFVFEADGQLLLPAVAPTDNNHAASKSYVDTAAAGAAAASGLLPIAIGSVVSNALVSGAIGVTSVTRTGTGTYEVTTTTSAASTSKLICMTTVADESSPLVRNWTAFPRATAVNKVVVRTGGGNSWAIADRDFNFVIYSVP